MHISDMLMHREPELVRSRSMKPLGVGKATPREVLWHNEWASPMGTARTIQNQAPKRGWSFL